MILTMFTNLPLKNEVKNDGTCGESIRESKAFY